MQTREIKTDSFHWVDITDPTTADLEKIGKQFSLDATAIHDCMEPEHLPKHETLNETHFVILPLFLIIHYNEAKETQQFNELKTNRHDDNAVIPVT